MKVILISNVLNLGNIGDVVEVKNGYAKNFLIPSKKAISFTLNNKKIFEANKANFEKISQEKLGQASSIREKIFGKNVIIIENASDDGRLYGSVNSSVIAGKINEVLGEKVISKSEVSLKKPIKEIGIFDALINLHSELSFSVKLVVTRSESEAEALIKGANKKQESEEESSEVVEERETKKRPKKAKSS